MTLPPFNPCPTWLVAMVLCFSAIAGGEKRFDSPEDAVRTLKVVAEANDTHSLAEIFGSAYADIVSPDAVQAARELEWLGENLAAQSSVIRSSQSKAEIWVGPTAWPFPIPIVQDAGKWYFDTTAGREEIVSRRIGVNELSTIRVCHSYVEAQREYASRDWDGNQLLEYAQRLASSPGRKDGLYWPVAEGEEHSPLGPLIAEAQAEGYSATDQKGSPYHGYRFKILRKQGKHAPGGKYNYVINGHMIGGFALVAWPIEWGESGVMTFVVNHQGKVFQKDLGPKTVRIASSMKMYDPDDTWKPVP